MPLIDIRRVFTQVEDIHHEGGPRAARPLRRGAIAAVLTNPYAGRYEPDILPMMEALNPVGLDMARRLLAAMAVPPEAIQAYGKGAIIGAAGELEHGALWHVPGAPKPDEMVLILAMSCGARVHARVGGLAADAIAKWDGQR